ncbi:MAG: hypothetical protein WCA98_01480 [Candidatus Acidiferrales bacterium]
MPIEEKAGKNVRTTVTLPKPIYQEARSLVDQAASPGGSMNGFFVTAIVAYLKLLKRKQIDAKFAAMAEDADYQKESKLISEEFTQSDWEAFENIQKGA